MGLQGYTLKRKCYKSKCWNFTNPLCIKLQGIDREEFINQKTKKIINCLYGKKKKDEISILTKMEEIIREKKGKKSQESKVAL